jgi:hypothetical protein
MIGRTIISRRTGSDPGTAADDDVVDEQLEQVRVDEPDEARRQDRDEDDATWSQ